jgi:hypothetical protein
MEGYLMSSKLLSSRSEVSDMPQCKVTFVLPFRVLAGLRGRYSGVRSFPQSIGSGSMSKDALNEALKV